MTKKDYQAIAGALYRSRIAPCADHPDCTDHPDHSAQWDATRDAVADVLAADSPQFDRECFVAACEDGNVGRRPKRKPRIVMDSVQNEWDSLRERVLPPENWLSE